MADAIDLGEWWAVLTNGEWFCGKRGPGRKLTSLNKINMPFSVQPVKGGGVAPRTDVLVYPWLGVDSLEIPEGALWIAITATKGVPWDKIIPASEGLKLQERAKRSGLHLA